MPTSRLFKQKNHIADLLLIGMIGLITVFYWQGVSEVPFHPDESTYLFMSADWDTFISHPASLAYQPIDSSIRQKYRLLDPPLVRYLVGAARASAGYPALGADWNWGASWIENIQSKALPSQGLLTAGRLGPAALFPFSLVLIYLSGWRIRGRFLGWTVMLLLATNALVLLHTRRAMAEGGLLFTVCFFIASLAFCRKQPWIIAFPTALMICAKQTTLPLIIVALIAIFLYTKRPIRVGLLIGNLAIFTAILVAIFMLFNPVFWAEPLQAIQSGLLARQDLLARQSVEFGLAQPDSLANTPWKSALAIIANLFMIPPSIADVGNYLAETGASALRYLANPLQVLFRSNFQGGIMLALSLVGFFFAVRQAFLPGFPQNKALLLIASATIIQFLALDLTVALPFQRYVIPLIPFTCVWIGFCLVLLIEKIAGFLRNRQAILH